jgi:hypothetical protein
VQALLQHTLCLEAPLIEVVVAAAGVFMFYSSSRVDEMRNVTVGDLSIAQKRVEVFIARRKSDQYRQGNVVYLPVDDHRVMTVVGQLGRRLGGRDPGVPLFPNVNATRGDTRMPRTTFTRTLNSVLEGPGHFAENVSTHSFRSADMTEARAAGVAFSDMMRFGRWRSEGSASRYVAPAEDQLLAPGRALARSVARGQESRLMGTTESAEEAQTPG